MACKGGYVVISNIKFKFYTMVLLGLAVIATACSATKASTVTSTTTKSISSHLTSINVGTLPAIDEVVIWLGVKQGFFKQHGLLVRYSNISGGGAAIVPALESGSVQLAQFSTPVFMTATAKGVPLKSIAGVDYIGGSVSPEAILVKSTSGINSISQLQNKVIAVNATNSLEMMRLLTEVLPAAHLTQSQVRIVPIPWPDMKEALLTGEVQAVIPFEPFTTEIEQTPGVKVLTEMRRFVPRNGIALGIVAGMDSYVSSHPAVIKAFRAGLAESIAYVENHPGQAAAVASNVLKIPQVITLKALKTFEFNSEGKLDLKAMINTAAALKASGLIPTSYNPDSYITR